MAKHADYVLSFMISPNKNQVALIKKLRPEWQAGRYNGIGGGVEEGETIIEAVAREFKEETGCATSEYEWETVGYLVNTDGSKVHIFYTISRDIYHLRTTTDEEISVFKIDKLGEQLASYPLLGNVNWLIRMCLDHCDNKFNVVINYE